jgi:hypothetical protein
MKKGSQQLQIIRAELYNLTQPQNIAAKILAVDDNYP